MTALFGEYRHKVDAKGRLTLPSPFRKALTEETQLVVVPSTKNEFLSVYKASRHGSTPCSKSAAASIRATGCMSSRARS